MGLWTSIKEMDKKFSWSFLGFLIGIIGIYFTIYTIYFLDVSPNITYEVLTNTNVIDVKESIGKLDILYNGKSLTKDNSDLHIITFKIINRGNKNVLKTEYDSNNPWGFYIKDGKIIEEPVLIQASNDYLKDSVRIFNNSGKVFFSEVIFEENEYFIIKTLVVTNKNVTPQVLPLGKIAGVKEIKVIENSTKDKENELGFWSKILYGDFLIHLFRFFLYIIGIPLLLMSIVLPLISISEYFSTKKKNKLINKFKKTIEDEGLNEKYEMVFSLYQKYGEIYLKRVLHLLENKKKLTGIITVNEYTNYDIIQDREMAYREHYLLEAALINKLVKRNIVVKDNDDITVDEEFVSCLKKFIEYLGFFE